MEGFTRITVIDSLPLLGSMQFPEDEPSKSTEATGRRFALGPILASVLLHALGLYSFMEYRVETPQRASTDPVPITMQLVPPPQTRVLEPPQALSIPSEDPLEEFNWAPVSQALPPPLVDLPQSPPTQVTVDTTPPPLPASDSIAPTRLTVRRVVEQVRSEEEQRTRLQVCTPVQKRNPMLLCGDDRSTAFDNTQRNGDRDFFAATLGGGDGLAREARVRRIANGLRESGMSQSEIERYVEGIDVNSQQRSTSGDARAGAVRDQMFRNDSTYQQMRRVLNP